MVDNIDLLQDNCGENMEEIEVDNAGEKPTLNPVQEKRIDEGRLDKVESSRDENKTESLILDEELTVEVVPDQDEVVLEKHTNDLLNQDRKLGNTKLEEAFTVEVYNSLKTKICPAS